MISIRRAMRIDWLRRGRYQENAPIWMIQPHCWIKCIMVARSVRQQMASRQSKPHASCFDLSPPPLLTQSQTTELQGLFRKLLLGATIRKGTLKRVSNILHSHGPTRFHRVWKCLYLARTEQLDIFWTVNTMAKSVTKWNNVSGKMLARQISHIWFTKVCRQFCFVGY